MKTITKQYKLIVFLCISILTISCETDVTDDITIAESTPKLVINGGLERNITSPLATQQIRLTTTISFLSNEPNPPVTDATVSITDGTETWVFSHQGDGYYANAMMPVLDKTYTITIEWNGETYEGADPLNEAPKFTNFYTEFEEETIFFTGGYFIKFDSQDPADIENYYYYRVVKDGEYFIIPDGGNSFNLITSDEFFDGQMRSGVTLNREITFEPGELATGQQLGISEEYFDYLFELFTQTGSSGGFGGNPPPATIRSNVINLTTPSNRAVGYFYSVDVEEGSVVVEE